jgi:hypothetical protein
LIILLHNVAKYGKIPFDHSYFAEIHMHGQVFFGENTNIKILYICHSLMIAS